MAMPMQRALRSQSKTSQLAVQHSNHSFDFSLDDTTRLALSRRLSMTTLLFGAGTTGSSVVAGVGRLLKQEIGRPRSVDYLLVDAATPADDHQDFDDPHHMAIGRDGCGTDPNLGAETLRENYQEVFNAVESRVLRLDANDSLLPADVPVRQAVGFWLIAGCGGTSGGMLDGAITLLNDVARSRNIAEPCIHVVLLGPDLPRLDVSRTVAAGQRHVLPLTFVTNLGSLLTEFMSSGNRLEQPPGRPEFSVPTAQRIASLSPVDFTNRRHDFARMEELIDMTAMATFTAITTPLGKSVADRVRDLLRIGAAGRGRWQ